MLRRKERKKRKDMQSWIGIDEENLYTLKINCKGKRTVGKANEGIIVEKYNRFKILKIKIIKMRKGKTMEEEKKGRGRKMPQNWN